MKYPMISGKCVIQNPIHFISGSNVKDILQTAVEFSHFLVSKIHLKT